MRPAKLIKANGKLFDIFPADGRHFSLKELQGYVGGYIEVLRASENGATLVVNEEGKNVGLPVNETATECWAPYALSDDCIVGDVVLCHASQLKSGDDES